MRGCDQWSVYRWLLFQQYDQAMSIAESKLKQFHRHHDRLLSGMDSDASEAMAPDEMYLMLQADMITIKQQEEALQTEIEEIATKFHQLLETCGTPGTDSDRDSGTMAPPSTPSFMKTTSSSLTHVTNLETPTFMKQKQTMYTTLSPDSDEETRTLFPDNASFTEPVVNSSDGLPLDISVLSNKTLVLDNNSNYLESPHHETMTHTPVIEALPSLENTSSSSNSTSHSSSSEHRMSSSDGYPKSDESTDNQIVPECYDLDREFMSRLQYYSDFTVDRQRKINSIVSKLGVSVPANSPCAVTEDILERHVEGKESSPQKAFVKPAPPPAPVHRPPTSGSSSDYMSTPTSRHVRSRRERTRRHHSKSGGKKRSAPLASSTMLDDSFSSSGSSSHRGYSAIPCASSTMIFPDSESSSGSSRRNRTNGSNPRACSTMLNESFLSSGSTGSGGSSRHRSSSIPKANSTMICEAAALPELGSGEISMSAIHSASRHTVVSDNDCESVYTWSIHDGDSGSDRDISLEESYMKKIHHSNKKTSQKPPLPPSKRHRSDSVSSRDSDSEKQCQDHKLHKLLGEPCSKDILESVSVIQPSDCHAGDLLVDSLYDETECAPLKANTIPRSSTRMRLQDKSSGSSSMEARRTSLPDLTSVCTNNDDQSVPDSFSSASDEDNKALPERLECQGKSSSSTDNPSVSASVLEPSGLSAGSGNIDSILTDSPTSVCSSGINAPYNSPGTNISSSSRVSCSTTSDARSSDSNANVRAPAVKLLPRNIPMPSDSPKLQNIDSQTQQNGAVFKIPKQNLPLRHLFKFGRKTPGKSPKSKTPVAAGATARPASDEGEGRSRRQLFPSAGTANLQQEARVMDKKAVIKKFKRFSSSFGKTDRSGRPKIETLAQL